MTCNGTGIIPDPDRGSGWGPYWDTPCPGCEACTSRIPSPEEVEGFDFDALMATDHKEPVAELQNEAISGPLPPRSYLPTSTPPAGPQEAREGPVEGPGECDPDAPREACNHRMTLGADEHCAHWYEADRCCYCGAE